MQGHVPQDYEGEDHVGWEGRWVGWVGGACGEGVVASWVEDKEVVHAAGGTYC